MSKKLRIGVFGAYRGMLMIEVLVSHPDAELVAVCDKYEPALEKVKALAEKNHTPVALFTDFDEFLEYDMDAMVLANYATEHATYAIRALNRGLHVMTEVLPSETPAQAVALIEAVEKSGKVYAYAENYCYMDRSFEMWRRREKGEIGKVVYMEGEYVHDCSAIWPDITYGERNHWRNLMFCTYYCTHSVGPMVTMSGLRPVRVTGFELPPHPCMFELGSQSGMAGALEMVTFENGAVGKSIHGGLKREPSSVNYMMYGEKGMMETNRHNDELFFYQEGKELCKGEATSYKPEKFVSQDIAAKFGSHGGSDFYPTHFFIEKILGNPEGEKYSIDVYTAVDMGMCGLLAYRSILDGGKPYAIPNFRNKAERDAWRNDNACTTPWVAGDQLLPLSSFPVPEIPDETYVRVRQMWLANEAKREKEAAETK